MLTDLQAGKKAVGIRQIKRALRDGAAREIFLAQDADPALIQPLAALCQERGVAVEWVPTMTELGRACAIAVGAAAAATLTDVDPAGACSEDIDPPLASNQERRK